MLSVVNLKNKERDKRKAVTTNKPGDWVAEKTVFDHLNKQLSFIEMVNRYHYCPPTFRDGQRRGDKIIKGAKWILVDVDDPGSNVERKLQEFKLYYVKTPSQGNGGTVNGHKWHYFIKCSERLDTHPHKASAQIRDLYETLKLENVDTSAIDPVRYFAPGAAAEVFGTKAWKKRVKWCIEQSKEVVGTKWVPLDVSDLSVPRNKNKKPIHIKPGTLAVSDKVKRAENGEVVVKAIQEKIVKSKDGEEVTSYRMNPYSPLFTADGWLNFATVAQQLSDGESLSNYLGCPAHNEEHDEPETIGYGYAEREGDVVWFNCGGDSCKGKSYYIIWKEEF